MKHSYLFLLLLFGVVVENRSLAQHNLFSEYDSRKQKAIALLKLKDKKDTARVHALVNVFNLALINKQRQELIPHYEEALSLSNFLEYKPGIAACLLFKGNLFNGTGKTSEAIASFTAVINLGKQTTDSALFRYVAYAHQCIALIYQQQEIIYEALNHHFESLKYYENKDSQRTMNAYSNISDLYNRANNLQQATLFAQKNIRYAEAFGEASMKVQAYLNLIMIYLEQRQYEAAQLLLEKTKPLIPVPEEPFLNSAYYIQHGDFHFQKKQYQPALEYYQEAYQITANSMHHFNHSEVLTHLSTTALRMGNMPLAKIYADENLSFSNKENAKAGKHNAFINLSDYYKAKGKMAEAFLYLKQASILKDSMEAESNIKQINNLAALFNFDKKEREIMGLQNENEKQEAITKRRTLFVYILLLATIATIVIGYISRISFKKDRQLYKQQEALQQQKIIDLEKDKQLATINAMLKGQEEERGRIAKDLHDGIGSLLSGTKLAFINIRDKVLLEQETAIQYNRSLNMLDNSIQDIRKVAQNLMPEALVRFGLYDAVQDFCDYVRSSSGINVLYQVFGLKRKLNCTEEIYIYRIIQELINNSVKHAQASEMMVQLILSENKMNITVEDNGRGFNKENLPKPRGSGFANIEYRIRYLNGSADISSTPGQGTSANIELAVSYA